MEVITICTSSINCERNSELSEDTEEDEGLGSGVFFNNERPSTSATGVSSDQDNDETMDATLWENSYTSLIVLCLFSVSGIFLICLPFLPKANCNNDSSHIARTVAIVIFSLFSIIVIINLLHSKDKLHNSGLVLWPNSCKHCCHVFGLLDLHRRGTFSTSIQLFTENKDATLSRQKKPLPVPLYLTYIFSVIIIGFLAFNFCTLIICCLLDSSGQKLGTQETLEVVVGTIKDLVLIIAICIVNFSFIPSFYDAHFVGIPKLRSSVILLVGVSVWIAFYQVMEPFVLLGMDSDPTIFEFSSNCTLSDIMRGAEFVSKPFFVELPVMIAWFMIGLWSRFLPQNILQHGLTKTSGGTCQTDFQMNKCNFGFTLSSLKHYSKNSSEKEPLLRKRCDSRYGSVFSEDSTEVESNEPCPHPSDTNMKSPCRNISHQNFESSSASQRFSINVDTARNQCKRPLTRRVEACFAVMLVISGAYFGLSNLFTANYTPHPSDSPDRGRFLQLIARIAFSAPEVLLILKQRRMTRRADGSYDSRPDVHLVSGGYGNDKIFLVLTTGSILYFMVCMIATIGILINTTPQSGEEIALRVVSLMSGVFGIFRMSIEAIFLLCVHRQSMKNDSEREWTLLSLLYVGMLNITQWLWDSLIHVKSFPVVWPELVTFFDGKVGEVVGIFLAPFIHTFELHVAIFSYEVFKAVRFS